MEWIVLLVAAGIGLTLYQFLKPMMSREAPMERLGNFVNPVEMAGEAAAKPKRQEYRQGIGVLARGIERSGLFGNYRKNLRKTLVKANILMKPEEFIAFQALAFLVGLLIGTLALGIKVPIVFTALAGLAIPTLFVKSRIRKRLKTINLQLGDTIAIMSNALKAGHSFFQAVDSVSRETTGPISEEFNKLQKEINFGVNTETALENMVNRVGSDDLELMVTAVLIQRQIGGNLSEILDNISSTIRQRVKMKGEIRALTAQGRLSGYVIAGLPVLLGGLMAVISPDQIKLLFSEPIGIAMLGAALLSESIGIFVVSKIVNVEV